MVPVQTGTGSDRFGEPYCVTGLSVRIGGRLCSSIVVKKTIRPSISSSGPRYGPNFGQAQYDVPHVLNRKGLETATLISPTSPAALIGKPRWLPPLAGCPSRHRRYEALRPIPHIFPFTFDSFCFMAHRLLIFQDPFSVQI